MLSRVANCMYWMGRYIERAENVTRCMEVNAHLALDLPGEQADRWEPLIKITGDQRLFESAHDTADQENVVHFLAFDRNNPNSVISCMTAARENARAIRSYIISEMWEQINRMHLYVNRAANDPDVFSSPHEFYARLKLGSYLLLGIAEAGMSHDEGWHFLRMGRMIERADQASRLLDAKYFFLLPTPEHVGLSFDDIQWAALLRSAGALEMYRQHYGVITPEHVVEFLLLDREFPRAILHCLNRADESLRTIAGSPENRFRTKPERLLGRLRAELIYAHSSEIILAGLHEYLDQLQTRLNEVGDAIFETFFALHPIDRIDP